MDFIQKFLEQHPIYENITFSSDSNPSEAHLHPILSASQAIMDSMIENGHKRIAIILPDDNFNVLPLIVAKYLSNIQELPDYAYNLFEDIKPGQRLKLGKAVVEFSFFDKKNKKIEIYAGKPNKKRYVSSPTKSLTDYQSYHLYFERTDGALSKATTFFEERRKIKQKLEIYGMADIDLLALKRTVLNKTIVFLSPKKDFRKFLESFYISNRRFKNVVTYGEFDTDSERGTKLYNSGRLDCLPGLVVSSQINEIVNSLRADVFKEKIDTIVVTQAKYNEVINNLNDLKKCLKMGIPFVMFAPETEFETFPVLKEMGFEFWNWNPYMLQLSGLKFGKLTAPPSNSLFSNLEKKVFNAAMSEVSIKNVKYEDLKRANSIIRKAIAQTLAADNPLKQITLRMNKIVKLLIDLILPVTDSIEQSVNIQFKEIDELLLELKLHYDGTDIWKEIQMDLEMLHSISKSKETPKQKALQNLVMSSTCNNIIILVPDRFAFIAESQEYVNSIFSGEQILVMHASDFIQKQNFSTVEIDHLIVTFFDRVEYIPIKKTYCYKKLTFLLYTFENAWRNGFLNKFDDCIQKDALKQRAQSFFPHPVGTVNGDIIEHVDTVELLDDDEISEFDFERKIITNIIKRNNTSAERSDSAECIPVVFNQQTIGYFSPNHNLIDITSLCHGELDRPVKKSASTLCKGDIVLIRQSDKDIIYDKANELMVNKGEISLRNTAELWVLALQKHAEGKSLAVIKENINLYGANCDLNQIRYWLTGDTICPENGEVVEALSILCPDILPKDKVSSVLSAGAKVQEYHRKAGRWLTRELKYKANKILEIYQSGSIRGYIDEIGDVCVYTVESIFTKEYIDRNKINKLEDIL